MNYYHGLNPRVLIAILILGFGLVTNANVYGQIGNVTLTQEQINEVEKDPLSIIEGCSFRLGLKLDPGKLCDLFTNYLHDKCERLDYLSDYCGPIAVYFPKRIIQKHCISSPPLPTDEVGIEMCLGYVKLNTTYSTLPVRLTLTSLDFSKKDQTIKPSFSVLNPNALVINLISISFDIKKGGNKIVDGGVGDANSKVEDMNCPMLCFDIKPSSSRDFDIPLLIPSSAIETIQNMPYVPYVID